MQDLLFPPPCCPVGFSKRSNGGSGSGEPPREVRGIDIGTGASCIYPLLGVAISEKSKQLQQHQQLGIATLTSSVASSRKWSFLATDIDPLSLTHAKANVARNNWQVRMYAVFVTLP